MNSLSARLRVAEEPVHAGSRTEMGRTASLAPRYYRASWRAVVLTIDVIALVLSFSFGFGVAWMWADAHPSLGGSCVIVLALLVWFSFNHRYARSLSLVSHDEFYYAIAYLTIGAAALLPALALLDITQRSY